MPIALALCLGTSPKKVAPGPRPPAQLEQLRYFDGEWKCEGKSSEHGPSIRLQIKADVERNWYSMRRVEQRTNSNPLAHETAGFWGFDQAAGQFMRMGVGNQGEWQTGSSPGWAGDDWVWTGEINLPDGRKTLYRHTLSQVATREFKEKLEFNEDGQWRPSGTSSTCKK